MPNAPKHRFAPSILPISVAACLLALPLIRVQAQPAALLQGPPGYQVGCSIQDAAGVRACEALPTTRTCDAEAAYASQPSHDSTGIAIVNRGDNPVRIYWLNFQGQRILYTKSLAPGVQHSQRTFVGHNWLVTTLADECIAIFGTATQPLPSQSLSNQPLSSQPLPGDATVGSPPPAIPDYEQPPPPDENLDWTPGYWAWSDADNDYYWVPGAWIAAPVAGYLWTPGYWFVQRGGFAWRAGYWGPHIGFYGGINYGYGYFGRGFVRGSWQEGRMIYNSPLANTSVARVSYNGGGAGIIAHPNAAELAVAAEPHVPPTSAQLQRVRMANADAAMHAGMNNGHPINAAAQPREYSDATGLPAQHVGTFSVMHTTSTPHPAQGAGNGGIARSAPGSPSPAAHPKNPAPAASPSPRVAQAPVEHAAAQQSPAPKQAVAPRPRPVPHAEGHPP